jgi:hypothetical protein
MKMMYSIYQFAETWLKRQEDWHFIVYSASRYFPCLIKFYQLALKGSSAAHSLAPGTIGARQCTALYTLFPALHQFSPDLPITWAQVAAKTFFAKFKMVSFSNKIKIFNLPPTLKQ